VSKIPSRWLRFVLVAATTPGPHQRAAEALVQGHQDAHSRKLARTLPRRKAAAAGRQERTGARKALRDAALTRAGGRCEATGLDLPAKVLEMDHFFGKARSENIETVWMLSPAAHIDKTRNHPTRRWWLERFRRHAVRHGYGRAIAMVDQQLALEPQETAP
jgi:hypothetical protein